MTTRDTGPIFLFIFAILVCGGTAAAQGSAMTTASGTPNGSTGRTRTYFIAADEVTWDSVHDMTRSELEDLIDQERLDIKPREAKDDEDLAKIKPIVRAAMERRAK